MAQVIAIVSANTDLLEDDSVEFTLEEASNLLRATDGLRITRIRELATPDPEFNHGCFVMQVEYESILVGSTITLIS